MTYTYGRLTDESPTLKTFNSFSTLNSMSFDIRDSDIFKRRLKTFTFK